MSRSFDFVVVGVIWAIAVLIHLIGIELFHPGGPLFEVAASGTENVNGEQRATLWFQIISIYAPLLSGAGVIAWAFVREYRRQAVTGGGVRPP